LYVGVGKNPNDPDGEKWETGIIPHWKGAWTRKKKQGPKETPQQINSRQKEGFDPTMWGGLKKRKGPEREAGKQEGGGGKGGLPQEEDWQ